LERWGELSRALRAFAAESYAELGLGSTQAKFLREIGKAGRTSQAALARATATDPTLTGRALQTLLEKGWVRRTRSEEDRREYVLELSPAGKRLLARVESVREGVAERLGSALSERDRDDFDRIAGKLLAEVATTGGESDTE
jgi:DNA-binding MarR family transcriptional regulator